MPRPNHLAPLDVIVALRLTGPSGTYPALADELSVAPSQVHAAVRRLGISGLLRPGGRATNVRNLLEFLATGVRYAFPAVRGPLGHGIPTAYSAPPLAIHLDAIDAVVWSAPLHPTAVQGFTVVPLHPSAPALLTRSPRTYELLTLVDALRLADPRAMAIARAGLEERLLTRQDPRPPAA